MTKNRLFSRGIWQGAPAAIQVADRFHLLQNLVQTLEQVFNENTQALKAINATDRQTPAIVTVPPPELEPRDKVRVQHSRARRLAAYQQVWELHNSGWTNKAIAQHLGIGARTVYRYLLSPTFMERRERKDRGSSHLDPDKPYFLQRWNSGCHQARVLFEELMARGSKTSYSSVARACSVPQSGSRATQAPGSHAIVPAWAHQVATAAICGADINALRGAL